MSRAGPAVLARPAAATAVRCAIYTRKSTDEGLDQEFNSLDAQREAAEAYVKSQQGEGWTLAPDRYDDGGFSGGNMDRPALKRLLADIAARRVDAVLVYKLDRLSRSLLDFTRIMETFDANQVAFVSITQKFDTSTSMGRLMLHILLSFAQFEREMIAERTRDKMSAARRRGMWTGGMQSLGYDVDPNGGRILVNDAEAARVREIFDVYLREQSLVATAAELNARGWTTKGWTTREGKVRIGRRFDKANLRGLLTNALYAGKVAYKGAVYPGEHPAIVEEAVWEKVQQRLRHHGRTGGKTIQNKHGALLRSLIRCTPCDASMVHTWTLKGKKRYRYYACQKAQKQGWASCPTKAVPAREVEQFVVERIRAIGADRDIVTATIEEAQKQHAEQVAALEADRAAGERDIRALTADVARAGKEKGKGAAARLAELQERLAAAERRGTEIREEIVAAGREVIDQRDIAGALSLFDPVWDALFPKEQARILRLLVERVGYDGSKGTLAITFRPTGIKALAREVGGARTEVAR